MKQELLEKKGRLANEARQILDDAKKDGREVLRKDEEDKFNAIHADIEGLTKTLAAIAKQEDAERSVNEISARVTQPNAVPSGPIESRLISGARDHQDAVRAWFMAGVPGTAIPQHLEAAAKRVGMDVRNRNLNFRLAQRALTGMTPEAMKFWREMNQEERAISGPQSTTSTGGYSIQDASMGALEKALLAFGGVRQVAKVIRSETGGPLPIPTVNDTTNVGALIAENTTVGTQDIALGQLVLDAYTYTSKAVLVSVQLMQDNSINLPELLGELLGERLGRITNTHFTTATGTSQPNGVVAAATFTQAATGNTTSITYANLLALYHSVDPAYRGNARWMFNDNTLSKIKLLTDSQGRPLWLPGLVERAPDTIFGSPYVINQDMATMTISAKSILFGDFSKYIIRDVRDITLLRLDERYAEFLQVAFVAFLRTDGDLLNAGTNPLKGYQNST